MLRWPDFNRQIPYLSLSRRVNYGNSEGQKSYESGFD